MAYQRHEARERYQQELAGLREAGPLQGGALHPLARRAPRSRSSSRPARPASSVINLCANNYLGLSSHPDVVAAAHDGPRHARLRHVVGALHLRHPGHPPRAREQAHRVPRHRGHAALPVLHGRQRRRLRGGPERAGRDDRRPPGARLDRRRHAAVQGDAGHLQALRHGAPRGEAAASTRTSASA